jgi:hypothetical protein
MQSSSISDDLTYVSDDPNINSLRYAYEQSVTELGKVHQTWKAMSLMNAFLV